MMSLKMSFMKDCQEEGFKDEREDWPLISITLGYLLLGDQDSLGGMDFFFFCFDFSVLNRYRPLHQATKRGMQGFLSSGTYFHKHILNIKHSLKLIYKQNL